jgi:two-component sensor histidine kinase
MADKSTDAQSAPRSGEELAGVQSHPDEMQEALISAEGRLVAEREHNGLLRAELQHRVRNTLALVRSIFARSVAAGSTLEDLADHFTGRLDVLARYQFSNSPEPGAGSDLEAMVWDELLCVHADRDSRITVTGPEIPLGHDTAQAVGLALHELTTNSIKFGVLSSNDERAELDIRWAVDNEQLRFQWVESGIELLCSTPPAVALDANSSNTDCPISSAPARSLNCTRAGSHASFDCLCRRPSRARVRNAVYD